MDACQPTLEGQLKTGEGWAEFKSDRTSWIEGGQVWILELQPDDRPLSRRDLEGTHEPRNAESVELKSSSVQSKQNQETGLAVREYQHESDEIKSRTPGHLQAKEMFIGNGEALSQSLKHQRSQREKLLLCDQCGKVFWYPSHLARHQLVHSKQKAKWMQSPFEAVSPSPLKPTAGALQVENMISQNSNVTTNQSSHHRRRHFCDQCGKAFLYPSHLAQHQRVHSKQKAKWMQSPFEAVSPSPLKPTAGALQVENMLSQNSNVTTSQNSRHRRRHFCDQCGKAFGYPSDVARHQQRVHTRQKAAKRGRAFHQKSKAMTGQNTRLRRLHFCDQCGKAFWNPSDLAQHQRVHSRQKAAKQGQSQSEVDSPGLLESTLLALQTENTLTKSSKVLCQKSKATGQNPRPGKRHFCSQCGKGCRRPSELAQHQRVHSRQKAAKRAPSPSEADKRSPLELTPLITLVENISINSSKVLNQNSKVMTDQSSHHRRQCFCDQCGKAFWYPSSLVRHQRVHSEQRAPEQGQSRSKAGSPGSALQAQNVFTNSSQTLAGKSKATTERRTHHRRQLFWEQHGKAVRHPSDLGRHQGVHSRPKGILSQSEADSPTSLEPTPVAPQVESMFANSSQELHQSSKLMTDQSSRCSKLHFCGQCGKAFRYPSDLARHQPVHSRRKAAVPVPKSQQGGKALANLSEAVSPSPTPMTDRNTHAKKPYLCNQCGEGFWWCSEHTQHESTHFQERPYDCGICGRQFRRRVQLVKHQKWHEASQEGEEEGGEVFWNVDSDNGIAEYVPRELLQDLPPKRTGELHEPSVSPETCECGACDAGAKDTSELLPANSIWEIGISGEPYLLPLSPACECGCCETNEEGGSSARPTEPSLLQAEIASSTTLASAVSSCEVSTTMPTDPAASPGAQGHIASVPTEGTSTASIATDRVAGPPRIGSPDPEWLPSLNHPRRLQKQASSSVQGAKPHSCPVCSKHFRVAEYLKKHLDIHRLGKPYSCTLCGKSFGRRSYLFKHCRRIHSEVGSACP